MLHPVDLSDFKDITFQYGNIHTKGGLLKKAMPMVTRKAPGNATLFVKMATTEHWLMAETTGQQKRGMHTFGSSGLLETLRSYVEKACNGDVATTPTIAEDGDYDPMNEVECDVADDQAAEGTRGRGDKRARYHKNSVKGHILDLDIQKDPPEVFKDCREKRSIQLLIEDRRQVWLRLEDVPWAVKYLYIQHLLKGVPLVAPDSQGPTCSASTAAPNA